MPSNIDDVIGDVNDAKDDTREKCFDALRESMFGLEDEMRTNVLRDADWTGHLLSTIKTSEIEADDDTLRLGTGSSWRGAGFVEFGTGERRLTTAEQASSKQPREPFPDHYPPDYPYDAPSLTPGLISNIIEWVETKPVETDVPTDVAGYRIAARIANEGTHAHPFMMPAWFEYGRGDRVTANVSKAFSEAVDDG